MSAIIALFLHHVKQKNAFSGQKTDDFVFFGLVCRAGGCRGSRSCRRRQLPAVLWRRLFRDPSILPHGGRDLFSVRVVEPELMPDL